MTQVVLFTLNAAVIYFLADFILRRIEAKKGELLKNRQVVFFVVFLVLALVSFNLLKALLGAS